MITKEQSENDGDDARRRVDAGPNRGSLEQAIVNEVKSERNQADEQRRGK